MLLDAPPGAGATGALALNVWIRRPRAGVWQPLGAAHNESDAAPFEYFVSWAADGWQELATWDGFLPNMVSA